MQEMGGYGTIKPPSSLDEERYVWRERIKGAVTGALALCVVVFMVVSSPANRRDVSRENKPKDGATNKVEWQTNPKYVRNS